MKTKFSTKVLALVLTLALVVPMFVFTTSAEDPSATLSFASTANRTKYSTTEQVWEQNGITVTNKKGSSTSNVGDYSNPARFYKSSSLEIKCENGNINKIEVTCSSNDYATALKDSVGNDATASGKLVTITPTASSDTYAIASLSGGQTRVSSLTVYYTADGGETPEPTPDPEPTPSININAGQNYIDVDGTLALTAETKNITDEVVWSSDNTDVATVVNGVVTGKAMGTATITAKADEVSDTFEVTVYPKGGTTISIAEALEVCKLTGTTNSPYAYTVIGTITDTPVYSEKYGSTTLTIYDGTNSIQVYGMKGGETLQVGQKIVVAGNLVNYVDKSGVITPEFTTGATYELVVDDNTAAVLEELNAVAAYMSLAYKYNAVTKTETDEIPATTASTVNDILNRGVTGVTGTSYTDWSGKTSNSSAVYAGQSAGGNESIQLRSSGSNSGIVTTTSGGKATKITVVWNSNTDSERTLDIYGSNEAYTSPTELYGNNQKGKKIGSIAYGTTELEISGDYEYIGIRSKSGALYLTSVTITWETEASEGGTVEKTETTYSDSEFAIKCGVDADLVDIENVESCGIKVTANGKSAYYNEDNANSWTVEDTENGKVYVVVSLGDIIKDLEKLGTEFTVQAYVEVDGVTYVSEQTKTYSVASMINEYYTGEEPITEVGHLYDYLVEKGLIEENA